MDTAKDPVCGMNVVPGTSTLSTEYEGETYYFCDSHCKEAFDKNPEKYTSHTGEGHEHQ